MSHTLNLKKLAKLSNIAISANEEAPLKQELKDILAMVDTLKDIPTDNVIPLYHPLDQQQPLRADSITEGNQRELLQQNAAQLREGLYIVPQFVETE